MTRETFAVHNAAAAATSRWPHDPSAAPLGQANDNDEQPGTFRELADHCRDVVWVRDARNAELTYVNPAYRSLWGRDTQDARDPNTHCGAPGTTCWTPSHPRWLCGWRPTRTPRSSTRGGVDSRSRRGTIREP